MENLKLSYLGADVMKKLITGGNDYLNLGSMRFVKNTNKKSYAVLDFIECGMLDYDDNYVKLPPYKFYGTQPEIDMFMLENRIIKGSMTDYNNRNKLLNEIDPELFNKNITLPEIIGDEFADIGFFNIGPEINKRSRNLTIKPKTKSKSNKSSKSSSKTIVMKIPDTIKIKEPSQEIVRPVSMPSISMKSSRNK